MNKDYDPPNQRPGTAYILPGEPQTKYYEVADIHGRRWNNIERAYEYLIKWLGVPASQNSWEAEEHLERSDYQMQHFEKNNPRAASDLKLPAGRKWGSWVVSPRATHAYQDFEDEDSVDGSDSGSEHMNNTKKNQSTTVVAAPPAKKLKKSTSASRKSKKSTSALRKSKKSTGASSKSKPKNVLKPPAVATPSHLPPVKPQIVVATQSYAPPVKPPTVATQSYAPLVKPPPVATSSMQQPEPEAAVKKPPVVIDFWTYSTAQKVANVIPPMVANLPAAVSTVGVQAADMPGPSHAVTSSGLPTGDLDLSLSSSSSSSDSSSSSSDTSSSSSSSSSSPSADEAPPAAE